MPFRVVYTNLSLTDDFISTGSIPQGVFHRKCLAIRQGVCEGSTSVYVLGVFVDFKGVLNNVIWGESKGCES